MIIIKRNQIYNQFKPEIPPAVTVKSGDRLLIETQDALFGRSKDVRNGLLDHAYVGAHANPMTGPVAVENAEPGDVLAVEINNIKLESSGFLSVPNRGEPTENTRNGYEYIEVTAEPDGMLFIPSIGKRMPAMPMIGVIGTANP
jgi:amidase